MNTNEQEFIDRLKSLELPLHGNVQAIFDGTCALSALLDQSIVPVVQGMMSRTEFEDAIAGVLFRISAWFKSLTKLNHPIDIQAVFAGARSTFELAIDIKLLVKVPSLGPNFHAFVFVERFRAAKGLVDFLANVPGGTSKANVERAFVNNPANQSKLETLCKTFNWWDSAKAKPKYPKHWSGKDMAQRAKDAGTQYEELYRSYYPLLSWNIHAGAVGLGGISRTGIESGFGVAHGFLQDLGYDAAEEVGKVFRLFDADPKLRTKIRAAKSVTAQTLLELSGRVLKEQELSNTP